MVIDISFKTLFAIACIASAAVKITAIVVTRKTGCQ